MKTEDYALVISVIALITSISIAVWQYFSQRNAAIDSKRNQLLQLLLEIKTTIYVCNLELTDLLTRHANKMDPLQRQALEGLFPKIDSYMGGAEDLHEEWSSFEDGSTLREIEKAFVDISAIYAESKAIVKLIENGRRSYSDT